MPTDSPEVAAPLTKENPVKRAFEGVKNQGRILAERLIGRQRKVKDDPNTPTKDESAEGVLGALTERVDPNEPTLPSGNRARWLREGVKLDENGNWHVGIDIESRMSRPGGVNASVGVNEGAEHFGIHVSPEIEDYAYRRMRETVGSLEAEDYTSLVGEKMGWHTDDDGWIIPAEQIEMLTPEQYGKLLRWGRDLAATKGN